MPLNFPSSPTNGQQYVSSNITYFYSTASGGWLTTAVPTDSSMASMSAAFAVANAAFDAANAEYTITNTAFGVANAAFNAANNRLANGNVVLAGNLTSTGIITDSKGDVRDVPLNAQSAIYALTLSDTGKVVSTSANVFVPNAVFSAGQTISVFNNSAATISITGNGGVTLRLAGGSNSSNKLLSQNGVVTILCVAANNFVLTGAGLS